MWQLNSVTGWAANVTQFSLRRTYSKKITIAQDTSCNTNMTIIMIIIQLLITLIKLTALFQQRTRSKLNEGLLATAFHSSTDEVSVNWLTTFGTHHTPQQQTMNNNNNNNNNNREHWIQHITFAMRLMRHAVEGDISGSEDTHTA